MLFMDLVKQRYSCRDFLPKQIEKDQLDYVLEAGRLAPTAVNFQPQRIYVIQSEEGISKMRQATRMAFNAPTVLLFTYDERVSWKNKRDNNYDAGDMDVSIVATHVMLAAAEIGLATVWARAFTSEDLKKAFELPDYIKITCIMPIGYASDKGTPSERHAERQPIDQEVTYL